MVTINSAQAGRNGRCYVNACVRPVLLGIKYKENVVKVWRITPCITLRIESPIETAPYRKSGLMLRKYV